MRSISAILFSCFIAISNANAGFYDFTMHSRANCINNESISWHAGHSYVLRTKSYHYYGGRYEHTVDTGLEITWRSAAVHYGEGRGGWAVKGEHYSVDNRNRQVLLLITIVYDCSIYDGWWD